MKRCQNSGGEANYLEAENNFSECVDNGLLKSSVRDQVPAIVYPISCIQLFVTTR